MLTVREAHTLLGSPSGDEHPLNSAGQTPSELPPAGSALLRSMTVILRLSPKGRWGARVPEAAKAAVNQREVHRAAAC